LDHRALEQSIRGAVDKAERTAGLTIDKVHVALGGGRMRSQNYGAMLEIAGARIKQSHLDVLMRKGQQHMAGSSDAILHARRIGFALDGVGGIEDPGGYSGQHLFADFHVLSANRDHVRQHLSCIEDSYLTPVSVIAAPYASAHAVLRPNEAFEGTAVLDLGAGTSSLAIYVGNHFVFASSIAKGGRQISAALARDFGLEATAAERLKLQIGKGGDFAKGADPAGPHNYPRARELIQRQMVGILLHQKKQMLEAGFPLEALKYIVLTGGGAQYFEAARLAADIFNTPTRIGLPKAVNGVPAQLLTPAFSTLWGIVSSRQDMQGELAGEFSASLEGAAGRSFARLGHWLQEITSS
jgi:cell division protein FtsA